VLARQATLLAVAMSTKPLLRDARVKQDRGWRPGWFPFARTDRGGDFAVDLDPGGDGKDGQVVNVTDGNVAIGAESLGDWLWTKLAIARRERLSAERTRSRARLR
jgi:cell wall assembly regulator SMI1